MKQPSDPNPVSSSISWDQVFSRLSAVLQGSYDIEGELGRGGMAAVYLAYERALKRQVAIKVMSPELMLGEGLVARFRQEAQVVARLTHPNIVTIHAIRNDGGLHYIVMKYIQGRTLEAIVREHGALPVPVALALLGQIGGALSYAHRHGVIHRDIKPGNILIDQEGDAVVTDFGIAKVADGGTLTLTAEPIGTPAYMSPEQCENLAITPVSDQYSYGVMAYELLTGMRPFNGSNLTVMRAHVEKAPPPLRRLRGDLPAPVESAVLQMLEKDPNKRFASMADAVVALGSEPLKPTDPIRAAILALVGPPADPIVRPSFRTPVPTPSTPLGASDLAAATIRTPIAGKRAASMRRGLIGLGGVGVVAVLVYLVFRHPKPDPRPQPPPPPPRTVLAPGADLAAAVMSASAGDTIRLAAGEFALAATILITKPLEIVGVGNESTRIVSSADSVAIVVAAPDGAVVELRGVTLDYRAETGLGGVRVVSGVFNVQRSRFMGGGGDESKCAGARAGVVFTGASSGVVSASSVTGFCAGFQVTDSAMPKFQDDTITANQKGIYYLGSAGGSAVANLISKNETGIYISDGAPHILRNTFDTNRRSDFVAEGRDRLVNAQEGEQTFRGTRTRYIILR